MKGKNNFHERENGNRRCWNLTEQSSQNNLFIMKNLLLKLTCTYIVKTRFDKVKKKKNNNAHNCGFQ